MHDDQARPAPLRGALLARLKADTAPHHRRIEDVVPLLRPDLDRAAYGAYLGRLLGYVEPIEQQLARSRAAFARARLELDARRKSGLLRDDLRMLGWDADALARAPRCARLPALDTIDAAWGCLYVLEGSTLGGQILQRAIGPRLGLDADHGLRFLVGYGARTASSWRGFAEALERHDGAGCDHDAVVCAARETFETMTEWLRDG